MQHITKKRNNKTLWTNIMNNWAILLLVLLVLINQAYAKAPVKQVKLIGDPFHGIDSDVTAFMRHKRNTPYTVRKVPRGLDANVYRRFANPAAFNDDVPTSGGFRSAQRAPVPPEPYIGPVHPSPTFHANTFNDQTYQQPRSGPVAPPPQRYDSPVNEPPESFEPRVSSSEPNHHTQSAAFRAPNKEQYTSAEVSKDAQSSSVEQRLTAQDPNSSGGGSIPGQTPFDMQDRPYSGKQRRTPSNFQGGHTLHGQSPIFGKLSHHQSAGVKKGKWDAYDDGVPKLPIKDILGGPMSWIDLASDVEKNGSGEQKSGSGAASGEATGNKEWNSPRRAESSGERYPSPEKSAWHPQPPPRHAPMPPHRRMPGPTYGPPVEDYGPPPPAYRPPPHSYHAPYHPTAQQELPRQTPVWEQPYESQAPPPLTSHAPNYGETRHHAPHLRTEHIEAEPVPHAPAGSSRYNSGSSERSPEQNNDVGEEDFDNWKKGYVVKNKPGHKHFVQYMGYGPDALKKGPPDTPWGKDDNVPAETPPYEHTTPIHAPPPVRGYGYIEPAKPPPGGGWRSHLPHPVSHHRPVSHFGHGLHHAHPIYPPMAPHHQPLLPLGPPIAPYGPQAAPQPHHWPARPMDIAQPLPVHYPRTNPVAYPPPVASIEDTRWPVSRSSHRKQTHGDDARYETADKDSEKYHEKLAESQWRPPPEDEYEPENPPRSRYEPPPASAESQKYEPEYPPEPPRVAQQPPPRFAGPPPRSVDYYQPQPLPQYSVRPGAEPPHGSAWHAPPQHPIARPPPQRTHYLSNPRGHHQSYRPEDLDEEPYEDYPKHPPPAPQPHYGPVRHVANQQPYHVEHLPEKVHSDATNAHWNHQASQANHRGWKRRKEAKEHDVTLFNKTHEDNVKTEKVYEEKKSSKSDKV